MPTKLSYVSTVGCLKMLCCCCSFGFWRQESCYISLPDLTMWTRLILKLSCPSLIPQSTEITGLTSHLAQHRLVVLWVLIVLFQWWRLNTRSQTQTLLVNQHFKFSVGQKFWSSGRWGRSPPAAMLSAVCSLRFLLVTAEQFQGRRCDPLTPRRLRHYCQCSAFQPSYSSPYQWEDPALPSLGQSKLSS